MGGLFTPIGSMPEWAQYITYAVPPRFFNEIMRSIYLKGTSIFELRSQFLWLAAYAVLAISCAAFTYKKRAYWNISDLKFKELLKDKLDSPLIPEYVKELYHRLDEEDNPVLLVGDIK